VAIMSETTTMLAVVKPQAAAGAEIRQVKIPAFGRTDVLVKVKVASICGTDLHIYNWDRWAQNRIHPPLIPVTNSAAKWPRSATKSPA
jgi:threonine 3-dehydrogenase